MLRIIDPTDSDNDVGRASYKIPRVVKEMTKLKRKIRHLGPGMEEWELDQLLGGTPAEKEKFLRQKAHQDRNNRAMHLKMQKRIRKAEKKKNPSKAVQKTIARMKEKCEEFIIRRPGFAAEVARADYLLKATGGPEQDLPGSEQRLNRDTLMINPGEENIIQPRAPEESATTGLQNDEKLASMEDEGKSFEQLEREAKHAATIAKKREKRERLLQKRAERKRQEKEKKAQRRMEEEAKRLKRKEEESANPRPKAGKKVIEKEEVRN